MPLSCEVGQPSRTSRELCLRLCGLDGLYPSVSCGAQVIEWDELSLLSTWGHGVGAADPSPVDRSGEEGKRPRVSACLAFMGWGWGAGCVCVRDRAGDALGSLGGGWVLLPPHSWHSQIKLKGLCEVRLCSPRGFRFCPSGFTCARAGVLPGGSGHALSWSLWLPGRAWEALRRRVAWPLQPLGEPPPPQSPRVWGQRSPARPLPVAFFSL